jgi:hypothetical protein
MTKKAIGLTEFGKLSLIEQLNLLHKSGVHVGKRIVNGKKVILYQINDFYAEVYYTQYRKEVDTVLISKDVEIIQPYLGQIEIRDLDKNKDEQPE